MSFIYYAERDGLIKIGYSRKPADRMHWPGLEGAELRAVEPGDRDLERQRHGQFHASRVEGEWFSPSEELREHMAKLGKDPQETSKLVRIGPDVYKRLLAEKHKIEKQTGRSVSFSDAVDAALRRPTGEVLAAALKKVTR